MPGDRELFNALLEAQGPLGHREAHLPVQVVGVDVFELDDLEILEGAPHPRCQQAQLLHVGDDAHEEELPKLRHHRRFEHDLSDLGPIHPELLGEVFAYQPIAHQLAGRDQEVLAVAEFARLHIRVVAPEREHAERHVA